PSHLDLHSFPTRRSSDLQLEAELMLYPCIFEEMFCISALECMAAGAVPVTTSTGALPTTVGACGILIDLNKKDWKERLADVAVEDRKSTRLNSSHQIISY